MSVLFIGDFYGNSGPANANKSFVSGLDVSEAVISRGKSRPGRIFEALIKVPASDTVCVCSASHLNYFLVRLCRFFHKNMYYIMHGSGSYEYKINAEVFDQKTYDEHHHYERVMYENAKAVICVSMKLMELMKEREPDIAYKFRYAHFGFDFDKIEKMASGDKIIRDAATCISVGGGMPRKNNIPVCEAIKRLNEDEGMGLKFIIIGPPFAAGERLRSYDFVTYYESVPNPEVIRLMKGSALYIQNSIFDSFSIAVVEAIACGCSVLISSGVGASESISTIENSDIIDDTCNVDEIAAKIKQALAHPNAGRVRAGIDAEAYSSRAASRHLYELLTELEEGR